MALYVRLIVFCMIMAFMALIAWMFTHAAESDLAIAPHLTLADMIEELSETHGIIVKGLEKTAILPAFRGQRIANEPRERLRQLLFDFNYVLIQSPHGRVEQVIILDQKSIQPEEPDQVILNTKRIGSHHVIQATIIGADSARVEVPLLVDTGSAFVVLPTSMISALGLDPNDLDERTLQTANGTVAAQAGRVSAVVIGPEIVHDVDVAFIDDDLLGPNRLLGMSVLGRYRVIIDEEQNSITLKRR